MPAFLIEFNRRTRDRRVTPFVGDGAAREAILQRVALETLARTHARYFTGRDISGVATV